MIVDLLKVFVTGGLICVIGQLLIDLTKITPAKVLVIFVTSGVILGMLGIYEGIAEFGQAGATVPLTGFGYALATGTKEAVKEKGLLGAFTGGISATAGGVAAAILFGYLNALIFSARTKK